MKEEKLQILCALTVVIRRNLFGKSNKKVLQGDTVKSTTRHIYQIFQINGYCNPQSEKSGITNLKFARILIKSLSKDAEPMITSAEHIQTTVF